MSKPSSTQSKRFQKQDFEFGKKIGEGAYSTVYVSKFKHTGKKYATKVIRKALIIKENKVKTVKMEKSVLNMMQHRNVISLFCTFQDQENLYFVLELAPGGELFQIISENGPFSLEATQFYTAELVNAMEYMHGQGIVHRDLKPENLILSRSMHLKVTDFGTAKVVEDVYDPESAEIASAGAPNQKLKRKGTFCGTAEYVSPELLRDEGVTMSCDLWALGCIIFQFLTGRHPFKADSEYLIFQKILQRQMDYPEDFPPVAKDLVDKLLNLDPTKRLGFGKDGYAELKKHPFFNGIEWDKLHKKTPPSILVNKLKKKEKQEQLDDEDLPQPKSKLQRSNSVNQQIQDKWAPFLLKQESIIHAGTIVKKRKLSSKRRQLILTDGPRLLYIDPVKNVIKGSIPITPQTTVNQKNQKAFNIRTPGRTYVLEDVTKNSPVWVKHIREALKIVKGA